MIVIDTGLLRQLAGTAKSSNDEISEAANLLYQITTHNNWGCLERIQINDFTRDNKNKMRQVQEAGNRFYQTIVSVSNDFEKLEKQFPSMFSSVDSALGTILSVSLPGGNVFASPNITNIMKKVLSTLAGTQSDKKTGIDWKAMAKKLTTGIQITDFKSLDLSGHKLK